MNGQFLIFGIYLLYNSNCSRHYYSRGLLIWLSMYICSLEYITLTIYYCTILPYTTVQYCYSMYFSLVVNTAIRVSFSKDMYNVTEGEKSVDVTLIAGADHDFTFYVTVRTQDGTASCECHCTYLLV